MRMLSCVTVALGIGLAAPALAADDYPTEDRADYVFACMAANGQTRDALRRCSCSIDVVASLLSHDEYVEADTILSLSQVPGENVAAIRDSPTTRKILDDLRRAQAEAEVRCF
jgi:hypothetical protein